MLHLGVVSNANWWSTARSGGADGLGNGARFVSPGGGRVIVPRTLLGGLGADPVTPPITDKLPTDPASVEAYAKCCIAWESVANQRKAALYKWSYAGVVGGLLAGGILGFYMGRRRR